MEMVKLSEWNTRVTSSPRHVSLIRSESVVMDKEPACENDVMKVNSKIPAYGEIAFTGMSSRAKYIHVDISESKGQVESLVEEVASELFTKWRLRKPNLIISVTGGAQAFIMHRHVTRKFRQGIVRAAQSGGAWIVTGGTNEGVMKHTGKAIRDFAIRQADDDDLGVQRTSERFNEIVCVGVATWGIVENRKLLELNQGECRDYSVYNRPSGLVEQRKEAFLDPNHTHFVLVDDGTEGKYGGEIAFRAALEKALAESAAEVTVSNRALTHSASSTKVPVCCLVLEGGPGTLETVCQALEQNTPVVLVKNSGRCADVLATGYLESSELEVEDQNGVSSKVSNVSDTLRIRLRKMLIAIIKDQNQKQTQTHSRDKFVLKCNEQHCSLQELQKVDELLQKVLRCLQRRDLLTVLRLDTHNVASDLQSAILEALFKVKTSVQEVKGVLRLSLLWNRVDHARRYVFGENLRWESHFFDDIAYEAIGMNRVDFLQVLLRNSLRLNSFLDDEQLEQLYNDAPTESLFRMLMNRWTVADGTELTLRHVGRLLDEIFDDSCKHPYSTQSASNNRLALEQFTENELQHVCGRRTPPLTTTCEPLLTGFVSTKAKAKANKSARLRSKVQYKENERDLAFDLFIYCVLLNKKQMAMVLLERLEEPIAAALTAKKILHSMAQHARGIDEAREFQEAEGEFEMRACQVLAKCYEEEPQNAHLLLLRPVAIMGKRTCLQIARTASAIKFISEKCVQTLLKRIWFGRIGGHESQKRNLLALASCFLPPLLFNLQFEPVDTRSDAYNSLKSQSDVRTRRNCWLNGKQCLTKLVYFYNAPVTIFTCTMIWYAVFMLVMAYDLLIKYNAADTPTLPLRSNGSEIFLIIYVGSYACEEVRQAMSHWHSLGLSVKKYFQDIWNILDVCGIVLFVLAMIFGNVELESESIGAVRDAGRVCYAASLIAFYMKVLHWLMAFKTFGPKVYMVGRMLKELMIFFVILIVFILAWGVAEWSLLFPHSGNSGFLLLRDIVSLPFWQIFETFYLHVMHMEPFDVFEGAHDCTTDPALYFNYTLPRCPSRVGQTFAPVFVGIYVVLMNTLLINLLIAIFNDVISKKEVTTEHWAFQRSELILEFHNKSSLVPPFTFPAFLYYLFVRFCSKKHEQSDGQHFRVSLRERLNNRRNAMLRAWMCEMRDECMRVSEVSRSKSAEVQLEKIRLRQKLLRRDAAIAKQAAQLQLDHAEVARRHVRPVLKAQQAVQEQQVLPQMLVQDVAWLDRLTAQLDDLLINSSKLDLDTQKQLAPLLYRLNSASKTASELLSSSVLTESSYTVSDV